MKNLFLIISLLLLSLIAVAQTADEFYKKALKKQEQGAYQYASVLIDKAIRLDSANVWYWLTKADIQFNLADSYLAIDYIKIAISLDSTNASSYNFAGIFYDTRGKVDSALLMFDLALKYAENDTIEKTCLLNRGTAKASVMNWEGALEDFRLVLSFDPNDIACLNNISNIYKKTAKVDSAIYSLKRVIEIDDKMIGAYVNLGMIYTEADSLEQAIEYFGKAVAIDPKQPLIYSNRGYTYYKLGNYNAALADVNKSISMYPTNAYAYKNLALIYIKLNMMKEACTALGYAEYYGFEQRYGPEVNELLSKYCSD